MVSPVARGRLRVGLRASPPACAMLSNPMKLANNNAAAERKVLKSKGTSVERSVVRPSRCRRACAKSSCPKLYPLTMTMPPRRNISTISGTTVFSYNDAPRMLTHTKSQSKNRDSPSRTAPISSPSANPSQPAARATSRKKGTMIYATTPMTIERPNHWEKLAIKPRYGLNPRLTYT